VELSGFLFQKAWDKRWNREKTFEELKQILVRHSLFRPPHSVYVFTLDEVKAITYHYLTTLFRYYGAYFFVFTPWCDLEIRTREVFEKKDAKDEEVEAMRR
jgi:isopentenyldiphosphate isomerase